jgi:excisionase family DNA binding protein
MKAHDRKRMLRVKEAADLLGVSPNTVRAWGAAGKIPEYRHPANGYRLYRREELEHLLRRIEVSRTDLPDKA